MITLSGRKFPDVPYLDFELSRIVKQMNKDLEALNLPKRKFNIVPVGKVDASNTTFVIEENFSTDSLVVWLDAARKFIDTDFTVSNRKIIFNAAPAAGVVRCDYDPIKG